MIAADPTSTKQPSERRALMWVALGASLWGTDTILRRPLTASLTSAQIVLPRAPDSLGGAADSGVAAALPVAEARRQAMGSAARHRLGRLGARHHLLHRGHQDRQSYCGDTAAETQPIFAALLAWLLLEEPLGRRFWICLLLALCGAYVVNFGLSAPGGAIERKARRSGAGGGGSVGLLHGSGEIRSRQTIFLRADLLAHRSSRAFIGRAQWTSALTVSLHSREAVSLLLMALIPGLLALLIYYRGLRNARASRAAIAELAFAGTAAILNWTFLGAHISAIQLAGFFLLWVAILNLEAKHASVGLPQSN